MSAPSVYCIVLNLNGAAMLKETLLSIRTTTYPNRHVGVVDNGSTDGSQSIVRTEFPEAELIENGKNLGFGGGNNVGMQYAMGKGADWVILLNNDIELDPAMLEEMMKVAVSDDRIGALAPKIYYASEPDSFWYAGGTVNFWTGIVAHRGLRQKDTGQFERIEETGYITGCAFLVRASVLKMVGLFDRDYDPIYSEDADLSMRILHAGYRLMYVPRAKMWHKVSAFSGGGLTPFKTELKVEHNLIFFKRYARWYHWLTIPFCIGGATLVFLVRELAKGNFSVIAALGRGFRKAVRRLFG